MFEDNRTAVEMHLPADGRLTVIPAEVEWRIDVSDLTGNRESWGIRVADVTGATNHTTRFGAGDPVGDVDPATFLSRMEATESYAIGPATETDIGGLAAIETGIVAVVADHHLDVDGEGRIMFDRPNRVWLTRVGDELIMVQVWAITITDLQANLSLGRLIVESLRLTPEG